MRRVCSWLLLLTFLPVLIPQTGAETARYADVQAGAYYAEAVQWAVENEITFGTDQTHFSPNQPCTREQIVSFLWRARSCPAPDCFTGLPFDDVDPAGYAADAIAWAYANGIAQGVRATAFGPKQACTRAQAVSFLWRAAGCPKTASADSFADVAPGAYYAEAVRWAVEQHITQGVRADRFAPGSTCTRAQIVTFLYRAWLARTPVEPTSPSPAPTTPTPAEPTPAEPTPAEPTPTEPTPTEPTPTEPDPTEPEPTDPTPTEPTPTEPEPSGPSLPEITPGYTAAVPVQDGFIAVGTGGRADRIGVDGTVSRIDLGTDRDLTGIWSDGRQVLISGRRGTLLYSSTGATFRALQPGTTADLSGAVIYGSDTYAAACDGTIFSSRNKLQWEPVWVGDFPLISLTAMNYGLAAIGPDGDVLFSEDGQNWDHQNFNQVYDGLYPPYTFTRVIGAGETFFVLGYETAHPNIPLMMYTEDMEVWMTRPLNTVDNEYVESEDSWVLRDLGFYTDQIIAACEGGTLLTLPGCVACNKSLPLRGAGDLTCLAVREEAILAAGTDFYARVVDPLVLRQDHIKAEQAKLDVEERGAVIIDVRTAAERTQDGYIPGSLHIPVGEIAQKLPELVPDPYTELIFYCRSGGRAQTALEQARELGYDLVYNLGGLQDWPYEIVKP